MSDKFNSYAGSKADSRSAAPSGGGRTSRANSIGSGSISGAPGGGAGAGGVAPIASASGGGGGAVGVAGSAGGAASGGGAARVIKSGLLSKKAEVMKSWRPRFFVLEDQRLVYFIARDDDKPKAIALVKGCTVTDPQAIENGLFEFVATFPNSKGVVYHLASDNRAEADAWVRAIRTVATPEFTRGRLQEIEDKERAVSRVAHQSRLPGPAFELLQAAQSQAAGWYMAEAGPAYRSWLHNGEDPSKSAAASGEAKAAPAGDDKGAAAAPAAPATADSGAAKFIEKCTILWLTTAAALFAVFKVLGWLSVWFQAVSSLLLMLLSVGTFYRGVKKNLTVWKLPDPDAEMWTARVAFLSALALALLPADLFVPLFVAFASFNILPFRDPTNAVGVIVFGGLLRRRTTLLMDHPPKLILRLLVNSVFRREWDIGVSKANVLESFRGRERQVVLLEYQSWNQFWLPDLQLKLDQNWYNAGGGTYIIHETSKDIVEAGNQLLPEFRGGVVIQPWRESGASVTFIQNWDFTSLGLIGFLAARTMPSRSAELAYSLHSALAALAHRSVELSVRPEGAIVHADPNAAAAADAQASEAEAIRAKYQKNIEETFETLFRLADGTEKDGWESLPGEKGIKIAKKQAPSGDMPIVRGIGIVNGPPWVVLALLQDFKRKKEIDEMFKQAVIIQKIDAQLCIVNLQYEKVPFVSARDFLSSSSWRVFPDGSFISGGKSVVHDACPPSKNFIRAEILGGGFVGRPVPGNPNQTEIRYVAWSDLKGSLPSSLTKAISIKQPLVVAQINAVIEKAQKADNWKSYEPFVNELKQIMKQREDEKNNKTAGGASGAAAGTATPTAAAAGTAAPGGPGGAGAAPALTPSAGGATPTPLATFHESDEKKHITDPPSPTAGSGKSFVEISAAGTAAALAGGMDFLRQELNLPPAVDYKVNAYDPNWPGRDWMERYPPSAFTQVVRAAFEDLFDNCDPAKSNEWKFVKRKNEVDIFRKDIPGKDVPKVKGVGIIDYSVNAVVHLLWDITRKKEYDKAFQSGREIQMVDEQTFVVYQEYEGQLFVTGRDFVSVTSICRYRDGSYAIAARSIEHDAVPRDSKHVRGEIYCGGFIVRPVAGFEQSKSHVTFSAHIDLKGSLPSSIINFVSNDQPLTIDGIRIALAKAKARNDQPFPEPLKVKLPFGDRRVAIVRDGDGLNEKSGGSGSGGAAPLMRQQTVGPPQINEDLKELQSGAGGSQFASNPNPYLELAESTMATLISEDSIKDGWAFSHEEKDIAVWSKKLPGSTSVCVKGVGVINASPLDVMDTVRDVTKRKWYDPAVGDVRVVERVDDCTQVVHVAYTGPGGMAGSGSGGSGSAAALGTTPLSTSVGGLSSALAHGLCRTGARDFVTFNYWRKLVNGTCILVAKSVEHASAPPASTPSLIRGEVVTAGWVIKPSIKDANRALITYVLHVDLKGSVTRSMADDIIKKQPLLIAGLRDLFSPPS